MKNSMTYFSFFLIALLGYCCDMDDVDDPRRPGSKNTFDSGAVSGGPCSSASYMAWETSEYVLPYPVGEAYFVSLSHCGGSYHSIGQPDQYAIDFNMSVGTTITAARAGQVVHVEESGQDGGFPNNLVIISHSDGTFAQYMHLTQDGAAVTVGQRVAQGEVIGFSGNTGLAGYPHLHFVVTKKGSFNYPYESFPTTFKNTLPNERSLLSGVQYPAYEY